MNISNFLQNSLFYKSKRLALLVAAAGPADAMDIIVVCLGNVVIYNMAYIGDIQTSRRHIGGHQNLGMIFFELTQGSLALNMIFVAVD